MILFYLVSIFILGLIIGSFINCLIWRMYKEESIMGRSYCPKCKKQISWHENIPVFSFLFLRGRCSGCKKKISWLYPVVELVTGILFASAFYFNIHDSLFIIHNSESLIYLIRDLFFVSIMVIVFIYDLKWYLILDRITLPAILIVFVFNLFLGFSLTNLLIGLLVGGGFFLIQFVVSRGRWIGGGDIRLGALMGVMFSWPMVLLAIFLAYLIGSVISLSLVAFGKKKWGSEVPLGVFLTTASIITLFWGEKILSWYLGIF